MTMSTQTVQDPPTTATLNPPIEPVRKSIRVHATPARAFQVFTQEMDSWWPRTHHIGKSPMKAIVIEPRAGGAIYTDQEDGTICPWASVLVWDPPTRFVMAWQITPQWQFEPDLNKSSQVEVRFTPAADGTTLVELDHSHLERHGEGAANMRGMISAEGGWGTLLALFAEKTVAKP
jgi:uncharacterized protein YndB with AHSA1/START domain